MTIPKTYVDIHILQDLPPSNINRDDNGSPKQAVYGGVERLRVSSQAWKRATRLKFSDLIAPEDLGMRTRRVAALVTDALTEAGVETGRAEVLTTGLLEPLKIKPGKKATDTAYLLFFSRPQLRALVQEVTSRSDEWQDASDAELQKFGNSVDTKAILGRGHSLDVSLFGRMVADLADLNVEAAAQVAHAISTHAAQIQFDYFTAVDDQQEDSEPGAGMIGTVEFSAATVYRFATVGFHQLVDNLGDTDAAVTGIGQFLRAFTLSMPAGHQSSFAPRTRPAFVLATLRDDQPVNLVSAFERPVWSTTGMMRASQEALATHFSAEGGRWGDHPRLVAASYLTDGSDGSTLADAFGPSLPFDELVDTVRDGLAGAVGASVHA